MTQYSMLQKKDIQGILSKYDLDLLSYGPIDQGEGSSTYLLRTEKKQFVLTVFEIERIRVVNICKLLGLLEEYKFPTTRVYKPANGDAVTSYHGKPVIIKSYIPGQVMDVLDEDMIKQVGTAMAELHQIPYPDYLQDRHAYGLHTFSDVMKSGIDHEYESWLAGRLIHLKEWIPAGLPRGLIHGDVFRDNVLFVGKTFRALIDFEDACQYYRVFDLGMAVVGMCTKNLQIELPKVRSLVEGYQSLSILEQKEKESLQLFVEYAAIATSSWRFWKYNIHTPIAEKAEKHMEMVNIANNTRAIPKGEFWDSVFVGKSRESARDY